MKGRSEGSRIDDYVVEDHADYGQDPTEAIAWAEKQGHHPLVARVRHLNDKKNLIIGGLHNRRAPGKVDGPRTTN